MLPGLSTMFFSQGMSGTLAVTLSPSPVSKTSSTRGVSKIVTTPSVTATATGGSGYTYSWTRISGDSAITATSSSAASTTFSATLAADETKEAVFRCTVTSGLFSVSADVDVTLELVFVDAGGTL